MSDPVIIVLTEAGLDALVNAEAGNTANIQVTQLGLTNQPFTAAPTLTALPGEFKRIATLSGQSVSDTVIHMTAQDADADTYDVRGFALYLADGTLFGSYSNAAPIIRKTSIGQVLISIDIAFADTTADSIDFGDATFLYPPASETVKGVAEIATQDEVDAGTDDERIVTPFKLAQVVAAIVGGFTTATETAEGVIELATQAEVDAGADDQRAVTPAKLAARLAPLAQSIIDETSARQIAVAGVSNDLSDEEAARVAADDALQALLDALLARTITGTGLITGGGNLSNSRVLQVIAATGAEIAAGLVNNKAITPEGIASVPQNFGASTSVLGLGGSMIKAGTVSVSWPTGASHTFPVAFPTACDRVLLTPMGNMNEGDEKDETWWIASHNAAGFSVGTNGDAPTLSFAYLAIGH